MDKSIDEHCTSAWRGARKSPIHIFNPVLLDGNDSIDAHNWRGARKVRYT